MEKRYRIAILGKKLYKEIEVSPDNKVVRFGTGNTCDVRVRKELFFEPVELVFSKDDNGIWNVICSDNLYIYVDEVRKVMTIPLHHGSELVLRYQKSGNDAMRVQFFLDFDYENKTYDRRYNINSAASLSIGSSPQNNIIINSQYTSNDKVILQKNNDCLSLHIQNSTYGVYHNGNIVNENARIQNGDFFSIGDFSFYYKNGNLFTQQKKGLKENGIMYLNSTERGDYPRFNRNSRVMTLLDDTKIEVLDPPAIPKKPKNNLLTRLLPSLVMIIASVVVGFGGGWFILISIASAVAGIVTAIIGVKEADKDYKKEFSDRINKYTAYIEKKRMELNKARSEELSVLQSKYISEDQEIERMKTFSYELFDRCKSDDDFLDVRLGIGKLEAKRVVSYKKQERLEVEDDLQEQPQKLHEQYKYIDQAPIVCHFKDANAVGIVGDEKARFDILKNIIVDVCARQYHSDVKMFFVAEKNHAQQVYWFRMLPHVQNNALGIHNIVCDDSSKTVLYEYLFKELSSREQNKVSTPHILVFLYDEYGLKSHPLSKFVENAKELGVTFVFFGSSRAEIALGCRYLIENIASNTARLIDTSDSKKTKEFTYQAVSNNDMAGMIQLLAPVYTEEISLESSLTKSISLFELLDIIAVEDVNLAARWNSSKVYQSMKAPIGVSKSGVVALDLHDTAHGPHGLVAGTTGAGKSELLQTYIMSMATLYHPYEVGFVIIDFKGGGMANQFRSLPHMIGTITNIDGKEINRSLKSIKAELKKRQRLFAEADVNHIDRYILKFRKREVKIPLPHLILIVDEFAELKADQPEFMKELISAARIGRSLGVHLILATQKPSGQVDEQIWSNSRFKLCLKVQSQQDSNEVIKSPLAAEIKEPGRAYFQVGNNEIFELFQSAYSGASIYADDSGMKEFTIYEITSSGKRLPVYQQKKQRDAQIDETQLNAMVQYIKGFCERNSVRKLANICLPSLRKEIEFPDRNNLLYKDNHVVADLAVYDDPDNQRQGMYSVDLSEQNLMIIGSSQSGKTNLLQNILRCAATKYSPAEVNIYILDFASMYLKNFEKLNHVGGVVTASEDEKLKNLFQLLHTEMKQRKEKLLEAGASSFVSYREAGNSDFPHIILLIDNLTMLNELYLIDEDVLLPICREGLSVGITVVIANAQTTGIGFKYISNFETKIALNCNDSSEYSTLFGYSNLRPENNHGCCLVEYQKEILEAQSFKAFSGEKELEKIKNITAFIENANQVSREQKAVEIPVVPEILGEKVYENMYGFVADQNRFSLGINYSGVAPVMVDWMKQTILGISGGEKAKDFLKYLVKAFLKNQYLLYIFDDYTGLFEDVSDFAGVEMYTREMEEIREILLDIKGELERRQALRTVGGTPKILAMPPIILLVQSDEWGEYFETHSELLELYQDILKKYKGLKCCVIFTDMQNEKIPAYGAPEILKPFNENPQFIIFENIRDIKLFDVMTLTKQKFDKPLQENEAFMVDGEAICKIKTLK